MNAQTLKKHYPWITLVVLIVVVGLFNPDFFRPSSLLQAADGMAKIFIVAMGMTFAIYIGGIDLSSQQMANMVTVITVISLASLGPWTPIFCVLCGLLFGALSGYITAYWKVPSFIATLAVGGVVFSIGQYASGQRAISMDATLREDHLGWLLHDVFGFPVQLLVALILLGVAYFIERRTIIGRALKAIGAGESAAIASGLNVNGYKIAAFAISGVFAAIAGLMFAVEQAAGSPTMADGLLLPAIVAVLVGGTPLTGGVGGVLNTFIGAMIVAVVRTSMIYLEIDPVQQQIFFGLVLIAAIALTIDRTKLQIVK